MNNLLSNAIRYSKENTAISVSLSEEERYIATGKLSKCISVAVRDQGVGVPEAELVSIFDSFSQSSRTNNQSGSSGLGLSIAAEIIYNHNSVINVKNNKDGIGSVFSFSIPFENIKSPESGLNNYNRIFLFVDDEQGCCIVGSMILENEGFKVHSVNNGVDAINYLEKNYKDVGVVFLDMMMPGMNGLECLESLQSKKDLKNIPVVIQSGLGNDREVSKALSLGARGYVAKPYVKDRMLNLVENIMGQN